MEYLVVRAEVRRSIQTVGTMTVAPPQKRPRRNPAATPVPKPYGKSNRGARLKPFSTTAQAMRFLESFRFVEQNNGV